MSGLFTASRKTPHRSRAVRLMLVLSVAMLLVAAVPVHAATPDPLEGMLSSVPAASRSVLWYGSQSTLKSVLNVQIGSADDVAKLSVAQRGVYLKLFGSQLYYSPFLGLENSADWHQTFGFDLYQVDRELTIGTAPAWLDIMDGNFDVGAISSALTASGFTAAEGGRFNLGDDNAVRTDLAAGALAQARYNRMIVTSQRIVSAPASALVDAEIAASTGKAPSLASDPAYLAAVRALEGGDVP